VLLGRVLLGIDSDKVFLLTSYVAGKVDNSLLIRVLVQSKEHSCSDLVLGLVLRFVVGDNDVDCVPNAVFWSTRERHSLLYQPAGAESLAFSINIKEVHTRLEIVIVVKLCVSLEHRICTLFHFKQVWWRIESVIRARFKGGIILIGPWASVAVAVHVVFASKEWSAFLLVLSNFYMRKKDMVRRRHTQRSESHLPIGWSVFCCTSA